MVDEYNTSDGKFGYKNIRGRVESVEVCTGDIASFHTFDGDGLCGVYIADIPKFIKALQAAYDYSKKIKE